MRSGVPPTTGSPTPLADVFDVVITGAGTSMPAPSNVPSGDRLAELTWRTLINSGFRPADVRMLRSATPALTDRDLGMRLEELMEVLSSGGLPWSAVSAMYDIVGSGAAGDVHRVLAQSGLPIWTLNMDTLIESAGGSAEHLHGRWDDPDSIITTISQYSQGLDPTTGRRLRLALKGKRVLVLGYSGRDNDVMPLIADSRPQHVTWLHFGKEKPGAEDLGPEVVRLRSALGKAFELKRGSAAGLLGLPEPPPGRPLAVPTSTRERFAALTEPQRVLPAARVLFDLGFTKEVQELLRRNPSPGYETVQARIVARALGREGKYPEAYAVLTTVPGPPKVLGRIRFLVANANEIAAVASRAGHPGIGAAVNWAIAIAGVPLRRRKQAMQARIRLAKHFSSTGRTRRSVALFASVIGSRRNRESMDLGSLVDALTGAADPLRVRGDFARALSHADEAIERSFYSSNSQRAMAFWRRAEVRQVSGHTRPSIMADLRAAERLAVAAHDTEAHFWVAATRFAVAVSLAPSTAHRALASIPAGRTGGSGHLYVLVHQAELARRKGDAGRCSQIAAQIRTHQAGSTGADVVPTAQIAVDLISAEADFADSGTTPDLQRRLRSVRIRALLAGARPIAARALSVQRISAGRRVPVKMLVKWHRMGWDADPTKSGVSPKAWRWRALM